MVQLISPEGYLSNVNEPLILKVISLEINSEPLVWEHQFSPTLDWEQHPRERVLLLPECSHTRVWEHPESFDWLIINYVLHRNMLETVLTQVGQNSSPMRRSRAGEEFWTTSVRIPASKMLSWRTVFSPAILLCDISNLSARSGIFHRLYALKACLDFHIATMSIFINVNKSDVNKYFTK